MTLMDTAQLLGNFGEFVGAFAVVGTLVYLAVQVGRSKKSTDENTRALEENRKMTKADNMRQLTKSWNEILRDSTGTRETASIFVRGNRNLSDLDEVEQIIYSSLLVPLFDHHLSALQMVRDGFLEEEITELLDVMLGDLLRNNPGARRWWEAIRFCFPQQPRDHVNALLEREGENRSFVLGTAIVRPAQAAS